jgi:hypothetical protein
MSNKHQDDDSQIPSPEDLAREREQDTIVVPKGQSKAKTFLIWGLMIFVLFIFSVGGAFQDSLTSNGDSTEAHLSWTGLDGEAHALDRATFYTKKREYSRLGPIYPILGMQEMNANDDADVARMIVTGDLARSAGVRVTDTDLADTLLGIFQTGEQYTGWVTSQRGLSTKGFETTMRDVLLVQRFMRLLSLGAGSIDHDELVTRWQANRTEYSFEYIEALTAEFKVEVEAGLPDSAELEAWLKALPALEQNQFNTPETWSADFALLSLPVAEGAGALLLAAYPRPVEEDAAQKGLDYYNAFIGSRFVRPVETESEDAESEEAALSEFFSYEEVEAACLAESPLYNSFADWHLDIQQQVAAATEVDLAAECERLGFTLVSDGTARNLEDWNALEADWADGNTGNALRFTSAGRFGASLRVQPAGITVARVSEKFAPALPPFVEIESDVAASWVNDAAATRAKFTLEGVRDRLGQRQAGEPFEPMTTPEQFAAAASNAGDHAQKDFSVKFRDYEERFVQPKPGAELAAIDEFLRFNPQLFELEEGRVMEAKPARDKESVFLLLVGPTRPAAVSKMQPQDLAIQRSQMVGESVRSFFASTFDFESPESKAFLEENFDYFLKAEDDA